MLRFAEIAQQLKRDISYAIGLPPVHILKLKLCRFQLCLR